MSKGMSLTASEYDVCNITDVEVRPDGLCDIVFDRGPGWFDMLSGIDPSRYGGVQALDRVARSGKEEPYLPMAVSRREICGVGKNSDRVIIALDDGSKPFMGGSSTVRRKKDVFPMAVLGWDLLEDSEWDGNPEEVFVGVMSPENLAELGPLRAKFRGGLAVASFITVLLGSPLRYRVNIDFISPEIGPIQTSMISDRPFSVPPEFVRLLLMPTAGGLYETLSISRPFYSVFDPQEDEESA